MTTPTKRSAKARTMYLSAWNTTKDGGCFCEPKRLMKTDTKVFVLPAAPEDVERMRETVAKALYAVTSKRKLDAGDRPVRWNELHEEWMRDLYREDADAALTALGLTPAKKTKAL